MCPIFLFLNVFPALQASLILVASGYLYCRVKLETNTVNCDAMGCEFVQYRDGRTNSIVISVSSETAIALKRWAFVVTRAMCRINNWPIHLAHFLACVFGVGHDPLSLPAKLQSLRYVCT